MGDIERISAFMDGELDAAEHDEVVAVLVSDREARGAWARYHVVGDVLRQDPAGNQTMELADRVRASLASEPGVSALRRRRQRLVRPALGFAIAASVAVVAVIAAQRYQPAQESGVRLAQEQQPRQTIERLAVLEPATPAPAESASQASYLRDPRLNSYLVNFNEQRSSLGVPGIHPYVRIVGFEAE